MSERIFDMILATLVLKGLIEAKEARFLSNVDVNRQDELYLVISDNLKGLLVEA